jgi:hypothetical protein
MPFEDDEAHATPRGAFAEQDLLFRAFHIHDEHVKRTVLRE